MKQPDTDSFQTDLRKNETIIKETLVKSINYATIYERIGN
jgi:hypothetical protein